MQLRTPEPESVSISLDFLREYNRRDAGNWQFDLASNRLSWSGRQFEIYGFTPGAVAINPEYFIFKTTHYTEIDRVNSIIKNAMLSENEYSFRRRIIKEDGRIGFAETRAVIFRGAMGQPIKIVGLTIDVGGKEAKGTIDYNDPLYFEALYANYKKAIHAEILKFVFIDEVAQDLCQEVFVKAWNNILQFNPEKGKIYTWLINIARNHCKDYIKSKHGKIARNSDSLTPCYGTEFEANAFEGNDYEIKDLINKLPADNRDIINLLFIQGYSQSEVAAIKNMPLGSVKTKSRAAIHLLRTIYLNKPERILSKTA